MLSPFTEHVMHLPEMVSKVTVEYLLLIWWQWRASFGLKLWMFKEIKEDWERDIVNTGDGFSFCWLNFSKLLIWSRGVCQHLSLPACAWTSVRGEESLKFAIPTLRNIKLQLSPKD